MRIKKIQIIGLFDMFNHTIPLNTHEHLTIIYGINGIGKTMLFKILDSFFNNKFYLLKDYPFRKLKIIYDNEIYFEIENNANSSVIKYYNKTQQEDYILKQTVQRPNLKDLENLISQTDLYFIETQRLLKLNENIERNIHNSKYKNASIETVKNYSEELSELIKAKHSEYAKLSERLEISLGKRLINEEVQPFSNNAELKYENKKLEEKRNKLKRVGLFEDIKEEQFAINEDINDTTRAILSVNIKDMKEKLKIFDAIYDKLNIFLDILNNKRFSYKKISIHPKKGFVFTNANGKELKVTELSSGEQHEIVLLYELLFKVPENALVLIDEPEISLHVAWQKEFLSDMADIVKIRNFDILIATHSPSIIDDNWHLTVELEKN